MEQSLLRICVAGLFIVVVAGCHSSEKFVVQQDAASIQTLPIEQIASAFDGSWLLDASRSTAIDPWRNLSLEIRLDGNAMTLVKRWRGSREGGTTVDSTVATIDGPATATILEQWPDNRHLGAYISGDRKKDIRAFSLDAGRTIATEAFLNASVQQGETMIRIYSEYRISSDNNRIDLIELRSTRPTPTHYVFRREVSQ